MRREQKAVWYSEEIMIVWNMWRRDREQNSMDV
jgi:hypothetical protein